MVSGGHRWNLISFTLMKRYRAIPEYYDFEYAHQEMLQQDVPFFLDHLSPRRSVLELAVGTGRAAIPIAQAGHRVVGIDDDPAMLDIARRKRDAVGLTERQLELAGGDVRRFDLGRTFDWITILFNTFMVFTTLKEQDQVLAAVGRHLKPRGRLWIDIYQPNLALLAQEVSKDLEPMTFYVPRYDRTVFKTTEVRRDPSRQVQRVIFHYLWFDRHGQEHRQRREFDLTFMFPREMQLLLERHGLRIEHLYGNYDGGKITADSPRLIVCCRRR
jgi:SAM-dependent methyltransferase